MGEALGIPEWLAILLWVATVLIVAMAYGYWSIKRSHERVGASRPNLAEDQFIAAMAPDCTDKVSRFLWDQTIEYVRPRLTPHPDDDLILDLKIDDDDLAMDWPQEWAERQGFHHSNLPGWPDGWPCTIRNFGCWLDMGPQ